MKYTLDALLNAAYFAGADIVLFGHTHRALSETMQGLYVVNPGTAGVGAMCTYACIETRDGAIRSAGIHAIPRGMKMLPRPCEGAFCCFVYFSRNVT